MTDTPDRRTTLTGTLTELFRVTGETADLFILFFIFGLVWEQHGFESPDGGLLFIMIVAFFVVIGGCYRLIGDRYV